MQKQIQLIFKKMKIYALSLVSKQYNTYNVDVKKT